MDDSFNKYMNYYVNQQVAMIKPTTKRNRSLIYQQINDLGAGGRVRKADQKDQDEH